MKDKTKANDNQLDPLANFLRKGQDPYEYENDEYFPQEESKPPHY